MISHATPYDNLRPRMTAYIRHRPYPKQRAFLLLPHTEAFFGGARGGGKSDALLMAALQYVDVPRYYAIIFRKTLADADQPDSIMFRARQWLQDTDATWDGTKHRWRFPNGSVLVFGGISNVGDAVKYQGPSYQFIGWDELTHFHQNDFEFANLSLRRGGCDLHKEFDKTCDACHEYHWISKVPLRVRTASNPGGIGHIWVKRRYDIGLIPGKTTPNGRQLYCGRNPNRPHVPSFMEDNLALDHEEYLKQFEGMEDHVLKEQMLSGDWGVSDDGRFKMSWVRRYSKLGPLVMLGSKQYDLRKCQNFLIIDTAASHDAAPGKKSLTKKEPSWTVVTAWTLTRDMNLLLRKVKRHQKEAPEATTLIAEMMKEFEPTFVGMEFTTMSTHMFQMLRSKGFPMRPFPTRSKDKITRSIPAQTRMENGTIWVPEDSSPWLDEFESEVFTWTGDKNQTDDQVDCLSYAAEYVNQLAGGYGSTMDAVPEVV